MSNLPEAPVNTLPEVPSRREFLKQGAAAAVFMTVPRFVLGGQGCTAPRDQLAVAGVGVGGKGESDLAAFAKTGKVRIGYLCDVDERRAARAVQAFPPVRYCKDWRQLLDKEGKNFGVVSVATSDYNHAGITLAVI